jgi:hypothetical protein
MNTGAKGAPQHASEVSSSLAAAVEAAPLQTAHLRGFRKEQPRGKLQANGLALPGGLAVAWVQTILRTLSVPWVRAMLWQVHVNSVAANANTQLLGGMASPQTTTVPWVVAVPRLLTVRGYEKRVRQTAEEAGRSKGRRGEEPQSLPQRQGGRTGRPRQWPGSQCWRMPCP